MGGANHKIKLVTARQFYRASGEVELLGVPGPGSTTYAAPLRPPDTTFLILYFDN